MQKAWRLWMEYDVRSDDITVVVIFTKVGSKHSKRNPWGKEFTEAARVNADLSFMKKDAEVDELSEWMAGMDFETSDF